MAINHENNFKGNFYYNKDGLLHRENGPAAQYLTGKKEWYINGQLHRTGGPAVEYLRGPKFWYQNGVPHRVDGPAFEFRDKSGHYWYCGIYYPEVKNNQQWGRLLKILFLI